MISNVNVSYDAKFNKFPPHGSHTMKKCLISALCSIEVLAYGANSNRTSRYGYVKLNQVPVWQASWYGRFRNRRGVNIVVVDHFRCSVREIRQFDTFGNPNATVDLILYLQQVYHGSIIVGVSADEPTRSLTRALPTLAEMIGANVADVQYRGAFAFVAQRGFPAKTVLRKALTQEESFTNQPHFNVTITGAICCSMQCAYFRRILLWT